MFELSQKTLDAGQVARHSISVLTETQATAAAIVHNLETELARCDFVVTDKAMDLARDLRGPARTLPTAARTAAATVGMMVRFSSVGCQLSRRGVLVETSTVRAIARAA